MEFVDRTDVGRRLADKLEPYKDKDCIVYALPRGGVVPAAIVARRLLAPLDLLITRKVGHPYHPEYAIAAVTEKGIVVGSRRELGILDEKWLDIEIKRQQDEVRRRRKVYLQDKVSLSPKGKIAIIVDDGIATGLTMKAAIKELRQQNPAKIIVAIPVAPKDVVDELEKDVDEVVGLIIPDEFAGAVGAYYQQFNQVSDKEVIELLNSFSSDA
ncbi:MAG TPA: phosphoribosyltransferase family protein [Candidatus Saccharimonadales bacterium]|nr:phosphoribosyltransferase family protein [Candidatus Saccharimonadales bacterium]